MAGAIRRWDSIGRHLVAVEYEVFRVLAHKFASCGSQSDRGNDRKPAASERHAMRKAPPMTDDQLPANPDLLSLCAIIRWFDAETLASLSGRDEGELARFLASAYVVSATESAGAYQLRDDVQAEVLTQLRAERPHDELTIHTRIFEHFLRQMEQYDLDSRRTANEERCFYHLAELRNLLWERREWHTIARHVAAARAAGPQQARHLRRLSFYEGFVAIRIQEYDRGESILMILLSQPDL